MSETGRQEPGAAEAAPGFLLPPGFADDLMRSIAENLAAADAWYTSQVGSPQPPPWRTRLRWKLRWLRESAARLAYRAISGDWPCDGSDHY